MKIQYKNNQIKITPDWKHGDGFRWYVENKSTGQSVRSDRVFLTEELAEQAIKSLIDEHGETPF